MTLPVYAFGSTSKGNHPAEWNKNGTDTNYSVLKSQVLQCTDLETNANKFYSLEVQQHSKGSFRLFSHYGRTDDLANRDSAGQKECRYADQVTVEKEYQKILKSKLRKGYLEVNLAKSKIGSDKAKGQSSGAVDEKTLAVAEQAKPKAVAKPQLEPELAALVKLIYEEAGQALTAQTAVRITAEGFETPLGILTLGQVEKGFDLVAQLRQAIMESNPALIKELSGTFYSTIPHKIGRTKAAIEASAINTIERSDSAEETLQLMKDMLSVNAAGGVNLFADQQDYGRYQALNTKIQFLQVKDKDRKRVEEFILTSQGKTRMKPKIHGVYVVGRAGESDSFNPKKLKNVTELFHGTRSQNIVGIMTRGLLLPNQSKRYGAVLTGAMLGNGIYFADNSAKSLQYCRACPGRRGFLFLASVALGKSKEYTDAQTHLNAPPPGYDSVTGVASVKTATWGRLVHNEYVIYDPSQQKLDYMVEFELT